MPGTPWRMNHNGCPALHCVAVLYRIEHIAQMFLLCTVSHDLSSVRNSKYHHQARMAESARSSGRLQTSWIRPISTSPRTVSRPRHPLIIQIAHSGISRVCIQGPPQTRSALAYRACGSYHARHAFREWVKAALHRLVSTPAALRSG